MAIKFLCHMIIEEKRYFIDENKFELSHWYYSSELPYVAMRNHLGFYDTYEEAEAAHFKQVVIDKLSERENE